MSAELTEAPGMGDGCVNSAGRTPTATPNGNGRADVPAPPVSSGRATRDRLRETLFDAVDAMESADACSVELVETLAALREEAIAARTTIGDLERQLVAEAVKVRDAHAELDAVRAERLALQMAIREHMHAKRAEAVLHEAAAVAECQREAARRGCVARVARRSNGGA